jgi:glycosyltransferase involved in cell wall biosynthesis
MNVAISKVVAHSLVVDCGVPPSRVRVIHNGTPIVPRAIPPHGKNRLFVYVANLYEWKAHRTLLEAFANTDPRCQLALVGDGPLRNHLHHLARDLGILDRVNFCGFLSDPWVKGDGAWACVHPPMMEGGGLAVMEAMMRGLPVVGSATGGLLDIVKDGCNGLLVPPGDSRALATAVQRLADHPAERRAYADQARLYAEKNLRLSLSIDSYCELYEEMLTSPI